MYKKSRIAITFNGARIKKTPELAIPEKEPDTGYAGVPEYYFFGVEIKLPVQAPHLGRDEQQH